MKRKGVVYVVKWEGTYKIGQTIYWPRRYMQLRSKYKDLKEVLTIPTNDIDSLELACHCFAVGVRVEKEWFSLKSRHLSVLKSLHNSKSQKKFIDEFAHAVIFLNEKGDTIPKSEIEKMWVVKKL